MLAHSKNARSIALLLCFMFTSFLLTAQERKVSGKITSTADRQPVPGATINVKGTSVNVVSDTEGLFTITLPEGKTVLVISSVGYDPVELSASAGRDMLNVSLSPSTNSLEEVVMTGYTTQRKKDLTGAVSVVDVSQMKAQPVASPVEALQGKATGVHIINDGAPGATPQIRIRGFSTINNNDPLFVIDGVPFEGKLSWLNQSDIESMQVLKDASAASIYGSRANNGVVIITTKKVRTAPLQDSRSIPM